MNIVAATATGLFDISCDSQGSFYPLPLGVLVYDDSLGTDNLLAQSALVLAASGCRLGGVVQANATRPGRRRCDMYLKDLLSGEEVLISNDRGNEAKGCRLDPEAFVRAVVWGERALADGVDLLILNKFGKQEAQGKGFRPLIAEALISGIPVVLGVSRLNLDACIEFAGGSATCLVPDRDAIVSWCRNAIGRKVDAL